jgi:integrase
MTDTRMLEPVKGRPGIYRRHATGCKRGRSCGCPYIVRWKAGGKSHKQMFPTLALAREHKESIGSGKRSRRPQSKATVREYYAQWIKTYRGRTKRGLDESTRAEYARSFRLHILPLQIARIRMRDLDAADVDAWLTELEERGASPWVIRNARAALAAMLATAQQYAHIDRNVASGVRYVPSEAAKKAHPIRKRKQLTAADITTILEALPAEWRCFFMLLAQSGLRISEQLGLTWDNVHLGDDPHIFVAEQFRHGQRKALKTESSAGRVPLSQGMASWLSELRPENVSPDTPVFPSKAGTPLGYSNVLRRVLHPALKKAGLDGQGVGFHSFRRACGSLLLAEGDRNLEEIQRWLRHAQLSTTTNHYIKQADDGLGGAEVRDRLFPAGIDDHIRLTSPQDAL